MEVPPICPGATPALQVGLKRPFSSGFKQGRLRQLRRNVIHHGWKLEANGVDFSGSRVAMFQGNTVMERHEERYVEAKKMALRHGWKSWWDCRNTVPCFTSMVWLYSWPQTNLIESITMTAWGSDLRTFRLPQRTFVQEGSRCNFMKEKCSTLVLAQKFGTNGTEWNRQWNNVVNPVPFSTSIVKGCQGLLLIVAYTVYRIHV